MFVFIIPVKRWKNDVVQDKITDLTLIVNIWGKIILAPVLANCALIRFYTTLTNWILVLPSQIPTDKASSRLAFPHPSCALPGSRVQRNMPSTQHTGPSPCPKVKSWWEVSKWAIAVTIKENPWGQMAVLGSLSPTLTFLWRDQAQAYFHQGVGSLF